MPTFSGSLVDVVGTTANGRIDISASAPRKDGSAIVGTGIAKLTVTNGVIESRTVKPGPVDVYIAVGSWNQLIENVVVPDSPTVDFWDVIESSVSYEPAVVSQVQADRIAAEAARDEAVAAASSVEGPEVASHSMASATNGMALPTVSDSGHPLSFYGLNTIVNTGQVNGRGAFWASPGAQRSAVYASLTTEEKPVWGSLRFAFMKQQESSTSTATIAVSSQIPSASMNSTTLTMSVHFWSSRSSWAMTIWDNGAQVVLDSGLYAVPLVASGDYPTWHQMTFAVVGTTCFWRTPDGVMRKKTDARFASLGGNCLFAESISESASEDIVMIFGLEGGEDVPPNLFSGVSNSITPETALQLTKKVDKTSADLLYAHALDQDGNPLPAGGKAVLRFNTSTGALASVVYVPPA